MTFPPDKLDRQPRLTASGRRFALATLRVPQLPGALMVQMLALTFGTRECHSLYIRYGDEAGPLEYVTQFKPPPGNSLEPATMLLSALQSSSFETRVLQPFLDKMKR